MGYILLHNLHSFGIWFITFLFQLRLLLRRLNHERLYTPHSCRKWQDQNDNFQILVVLQLQFEALIDIEIWGLGYLWEQRFTIVSPQKCLIRKELAYVDCWAQSLLSPLADTVKCKCQRSNRFHATNWCVTMRLAFLQLACQFSIYRLSPFLLMKKLLPTKTHLLYVHHEFRSLGLSRYLNFSPHDIWFP